MLTIKDLHASCETDEILRGLELEVKPGEIHAIMGPNGGGKSTFAKTVAGHPDYEITSGTLEFENEDITELEPEERASKGIFVGFQYPVEVPGVSNKQFLSAAYSAHQKAKGQGPVPDEAFEQVLMEKLKLLDMKEEFVSRGVNEGFSGERKSAMKYYKWLS